MSESEKNGREKRKREIESEMSFGMGTEEAREDDEHMGKNKPSNQFFIKNNMRLSSYIFRFIEVKKGSYGVASFHGDDFLRCLKD